MTEFNKSIIALTKSSVSILTELNKGYHSTTYENNIKGRMELKSEEPMKIIDEVFAVWGDNPTEEDFVLPDLPTVKPQPTAEQLAILDLTEQTVDNDYRISVLELGL